MMPNCEGCKFEIEEAKRLQEEGFDAGLEGMNEKKHCSCFAFKDGRLISY